MEPSKILEKNSGDVEAFYNEFSKKFIDDIVEGNERVARQLKFFGKAIPTTTQRVLIVGFGSGETAYFIANEIAPRAKIFAVDVSAECLRLARSLFPHSRIEYRNENVLTTSIEGQWEVVVLPDVYEHIPMGSRKTLHEKLDRALTDNGRILLTIPSPGKQESLRAIGSGLQIVDETVTLDDLIEMATDVGGLLTYFNMISVWETDDYIHAAIQRGAERVRSIQPPDLIPLKGWPRRTLWMRAKDFLDYRLSFAKVRYGLRRSRVTRKLHRTSNENP